MSGADGTLTRCPACGQDGARLLFPVRLRAGRGTSIQLQIRYCTRCSHRFLPTTDAEQRVIEEKYEGEYAGFRSDPYFDRRVREEIDSHIAPRRPAPAVVLDVGCGNGAFLLAMRERGYDVHGIDVSRSGVEHCREKGLDAVCADFLTHDFGRTFDIIAMWDVVEHLREPEAFLRRARDLLAPGGLLVLKIPGFERLAFPLIRLDNRLAHVLLSAPGHVQYFNRRSLAELLRRLEIGAVEWPRLSSMRQPRATRSMRTKALRAVSRAVGRISGSTNLFAIARRD